MLAEAVIASAERRTSRPSGRISPSMVSTCPFRTYKSWKGEREKPTGLDRLRMNDGHYQEKEIIDDLVEAGFEIKDRQRVVHTGPMAGQIDGLILVDGLWYLLDAKAMSLARFTAFRKTGFEKEQAMKAQQQLYLASGELQSEGISDGYIYAKHKDSCRPYDLFFGYEPEFAISLIDQVKRLYGGWIPTPIRQPQCLTCRIRLDCWGGEIVDFGNIHTVSLPEMVEQWKLGTAHRQYGKELVDEARLVFKKELGDRTVVFIDDLRVTKVLVRRTGIDLDKFIDLYGAQALPGVMDEKVSEQMRISEVEL